MNQARHSHNLRPQWYRDHVERVAKQAAHEFKITEGGKISLRKARRIHP